MLTGCGRQAQESAEFLRRWQAGEAVAKRGRDAMITQEYLATIRLALLESSIMTDYSIVRQCVNPRVCPSVGW